MKLVLIFLLAAISICYAGTTPWQTTLDGHQFTSAGHYHYFEIEDYPVLADGVTITTTDSNKKSCEYKVCLSYELRVPFHEEDWLEICRPMVMHLNTSATFTTKRPRPGYYFFTVLSMTNEICNPTFTLTGDACEKDQFGPNCLLGNELVPNNGPQMVTILAGEAQYFYATADHIFTNEMEVSASGLQNEVVQIFGRDGDYPRITELVYDFASEKSDSPKISIENPRVAHWYHWSNTTGLSDKFVYFFAVVNHQATQARINVELVLHQCNHWTFGKNCNYRSPPLLTSISYRVPDDELGWFYAAPILSNLTTNWAVGITTLEFKTAPHLYLRYGALPTQDYWDAKVVKSSSTLTRYFDTGRQNPNPIARWYVGVHIGRNATKGAFGLWFNSQCPMNCSLHGECDTDTNECVCNKDYTDDWFDCSEYGRGVKPGAPVASSSSGMSGTEVFLIVAVCLLSVFVIALLAGIGGFAVWFWKNGGSSFSRHDYETL